MPSPEPVFPVGPGAVTDPAPTMRIREATPGDLTGIMTVLDAGFLEVDRAAVREGIETGDVLVCVDDGPVIGALVLDGRSIDAIAVTPGRRGAGIGTALVERAADRREQLTAAFDGGVRGFWRSLGFRIDPTDGDRYRGWR